MASGNLNLSDLAALAGLMALTGVIGFFANKSQNEAVEARILGEMNLSFQKAATERDALEHGFSEFGEKMQTLVDEGLSARSDEVLLALSPLSEGISGLTVSVANFGVDDDIYRQLEAMGRLPASKVSIAQVGQVAYASAYFEDPKDPEIYALSDLVENAIDVGNGNIEVSIKLGPNYKDWDNEMAVRTIRRQISLLEKSLAEISGD